MKPLSVGIDFDNTIVRYDEAFYRTALEQKLVPVGISCSKSAVRNYLRRAGKEQVWTELQGYIYGSRMDLAFPYPGVDRFLSICRDKQIPVSVISHKTKHPFLGPPYDLHQAAFSWLQSQHFPWTPPIFFELTLKEKLERIQRQNCTVFIDDLPEVLKEKEFPPTVRKILFDPHALYTKTRGKFERTVSWKEISTLLMFSYA